MAMVVEGSVVVRSKDTMFPHSATLAKAVRLGIVRSGLYIRSLDLELLDFYRTHSNGNLYTPDLTT
jgi:hypothetical protein